MIALVFRRLKCDCPAERNREHDRALFRLLEEPSQNGPKVRDLLWQADALGVAPWSITAPSLFPVRHQEVAFEIEQPLKFPDLAQQRQAWAALNDEQGRQSVSVGAQTDALPRAVDVEI